MTHIDTPYEDCLRYILDNGEKKPDRTGTGTTSIFGQQFRYDLSKGFPLITTKKVNTHAVIGELLWFLRGETNTEYLKEHGIKIWDEWADKNGNLGPIYGSQWRSWFNPVSNQEIEVSVPTYESTGFNADTAYDFGYDYRFGESGFFKRRLLDIWKTFGSAGELDSGWADFGVFSREIRRANGYAQFCLNPAGFDLFPEYYGTRILGNKSAIFLPHNVTLAVKTRFAAEEQDKTPRKTVQRPRVFFDQIADIVEQVKNNPTSRRIILNAWNVGEIESMNLPPCHAFFQLYVSESGKLSGQLYQRSADMFLGVPFNIASYSLLISMIAHHTGLKPGDFVWSGGDCHIYDNHREQVATQLSRSPREFPTLTITADKEKPVWDYDFEDFSFTGYNPHPFIKAPVAV